MPSRAPQKPSATRGLRPWLCQQQGPLDCDPGGQRLPRLRPPDCPARPARPGMRAVPRWHGDQSAWLPLRCTLTRQRGPSQRNGAQRAPRPRRGGESGSDAEGPAARVPRPRARAVARQPGRRRPAPAAESGKRRPERGRGGAPAPPAACPRGRAAGGAPEKGAGASVGPAKAASPPERGLAAASPRARPCPAPSARGPPGLLGAGPWPGLRAAGARGPQGRGGRAVGGRVLRARAQTPGGLGRGPRRLLEQDRPGFPSGALTPGGVTRSPCGPASPALKRERSPLACAEGP